MKQISEYTMRECIGALRDVEFMWVGSRESTNLRQLQLADRINDLTRWVPVSERFPTQSDAKDVECIAWSRDGKYWKRIEKPEGV